MEEKKRTRIHQLTACAVMAAVLCVLGPLAVPVGPVPITLATFVVYLMACLLGWKWGTAAVLIYLLLGAAGLPVFSGYAGGAARLLGPTGGYLAGYLPMAAITGLTAERTESRFLRFLGMLAGTAVLYTLGTAWYCVQGGHALGAAIAACVTPFIPFDLVKMLLTVWAAPLLTARLRAAHIFEQAEDR